MTPNQTRTRFEITTLLNQGRVPAAIINPLPSTGNIAQKPVKCASLLIPIKLKASNSIPTTANKSRRKDPA